MSKGYALVMYQSSFPVLALLQGSLLTFMVLYKRINFLDSLVFSLLTSGVIIYILEIFQLNRFSVVVISGIVVALFVFTSMYFKRISPSLDLFKIPYYFFAVWVVVRIPDNFKFLAWDELSAWAHRSKWLYFHGSLWVKDQLEYFPMYPPVLQFLHQIYLNPKGMIFSEKAVMASQVILILALFGSIFLNHSTRNRLTSYAGLTVGLVSPYFFGFNLFTLNPDFLLGLLFAYGLVKVHVLISREERIIILLPVLGFIALLKPSGIIFSLALVLYAYIRKFRLKDIAVFSLWTLFCYTSWQIYVATNGINNTGFTLAGIFGKFLSYFSKTSYSNAQSGRFVNNSNPIQVLEKMFLDYFDGTIRFALVFFALSLCLFFRYRPDKKIIYFGLAVWVACELMLFATYIFLMSGYEADNTASHERYTATLFLAFTLVFIWNFFESEKETFQFLALTTVVFMNVILPNNLIRDFESIQPYPEAIELRNDASFILKGIATQDSLSILYVEQNAPSVGYTRLMVAYEAIPSRVEAGCWSFGSRYYPEDIWTCHGSLSAKLSQKDFVVIRHGDSQFYRLLSSEKVTFDQRLASGIFKVSTSGSSISLTTVQGKTF